MTSNLGTQIMFEYDRHANKSKVTLISRSNAPKPYPNVYIEKDTFIVSIGS